MESSETTTQHSNVTNNGKLRPASNYTLSKRYFCSKYTKQMLRDKIAEHCLEPTDGTLVDVWVLTRIDHWDHDIECTVGLTEYFLMFINFNFISNRAVVKRIGLRSIRSIAVGNLVSPNWSVMPHRDYGVFQIIWGDLSQVKWKDRWNPLSQEIPCAVLHHHPCFYSIEPIENRDLFDCNEAISTIEKSMSEFGVELTYSNVPLNSRINFLNVVYNQSNLGFCKDRNGIVF